MECGGKGDLVLDVYYTTNYWGVINFFKTFFSAMVNYCFLKNRLDFDLMKSCLPFNFFVKYFFTKLKIKLDIIIIINRHNKNHYILAIKWK